MHTVGQCDILILRHVAQFFQGMLRYTFLGHWKDGRSNGHVEAALLTGRIRLMKPLRAEAAA